MSRTPERNPCAGFTGLSLDPEHQLQKAAFLIILQPPWSPPPKQELKRTSSSPVLRVLSSAVRRRRLRLCPPPNSPAVAPRRRPGTRGPGCRTSTWRSRSPETGGDPADEGAEETREVGRGVHAAEGGIISAGEAEADGEEWSCRMKRP